MNVKKCDSEERIQQQLFSPFYIKFPTFKLCCMKVEVDMEKISAEIAAAEEAARKRMAEREKDAGDRGARETLTCILAEEEKHICATHGNKSQQNSLCETSNKEGKDTNTNTTDTPGELHWPLFVASMLSGSHVVILFLFL